MVSRGLNKRLPFRSLPQPGDVLRPVGDVGTRLGGGHAFAVMPVERGRSKQLLLVKADDRLTIVAAYVGDGQAQRAGKRRPRPNVWLALRWSTVRLVYVYEVHVQYHYLVERRAPKRAS